MRRNWYVKDTMEYDTPIMIVIAAQLGCASSGRATLLCEGIFSL